MRQIYVFFNEKTLIDCISMRYNNDTIYMFSYQHMTHIWRELNMKYIHKTVLFNTLMDLSNDVNHEIILHSSQSRVYYHCKVLGLDGQTVICKILNIYQPKFNISYQVPIYNICNDNQIIAYDSSLLNQADAFLKDVILWYSPSKQGLNNTQALSDMKIKDLTGHGFDMYLSNFIDVAIEDGMVKFDGSTNYGHCFMPYSMAAVTVICKCRINNYNGNGFIWDGRTTIQSGHSTVFYYRLNDNTRFSGTIYIDGYQPQYATIQLSDLQTHTIVETNGNSNNNIRFGTRLMQTGYYLNCSIADFIVVNRTMSKDEIQALVI